MGNNARAGNTEAAVNREVSFLSSLGGIHLIIYN
jgi:hypothetical protein